MSLILGALFFVMSNSADKVRSNSYSKSDLYSVSSHESVDVGPRVNTVKSDASSTIKISESIHNLTQVSSERTRSFEPPPATDNKAVRFS